MGKKNEMKHDALAELRAESKELVYCLDAQSRALIPTAIVRYAEAALHIMRLWQVIDSLQRARELAHAEEAKKK